MKKQDNNKQSKTASPAMSVTATLLEPNMLRNLVEKLADRRYDIGYSLEKMEAGWNAIDTSSIEAYVSGDVYLSDNADLTTMPFDTGFLFTCIKEKKGKYNLTWASSLS